MKPSVGRCVGAVLLAIAAAGAVAQTGSPAAPSVAAAAPAAARQLAINNKPWVGDFDAMLERRLIRVYCGIL